MTHFGGSLLPSSDATVMRPRVGKHGTFTVVALHEIEEHALFYRSATHTHHVKQPDTWPGIMIATHANGFSCSNLADRIMSVWEGQRDSDYAIAQFRYILDCGGLGKKESTIDAIIMGEF